MWAELEEGSGDNIKGLNLGTLPTSQVGIIPLNCIPISLLFVCLLFNVRSCVVQAA